MNRGKLLVAHRGLKDPFFTKSVVLLIHSDRQGAWGVIINRPTEVKLSQVMPEFRISDPKSDTVYFGGPVNVERVIFLIQSPKPLEHASHICDDIYISGSLALLQKLVDESGPSRFRIFAGSAAWGPGQLDREISVGSWNILQADAETLFQKGADKIWQELILQGSAQWARLRGKSF